MAAHRTVTIRVPHQMREEHHEGTNPTDPQFLRSLPSVTNLMGKECYICLERLAIVKPTAELPCGHGFDRMCIEQWLSRNNRCPVCRHVLPE